LNEHLTDWLARRSRFEVNGKGRAGGDERALGISGGRRARGIRQMTDTMAMRMFLRGVIVGLFVGLYIGWAV
jgi:hypothetical protein